MNLLNSSWVSALTLGATLISSPLVRAEDPAPTSDAEKTPIAEQRKRPGASNRPSPEQMEALRAQRQSWIKEIGATDEQMAKIRAAMKEQGEKIREHRDTTGLSPEERRAKLKLANESLTAKIQEILTPEQFAKYTKLMDERKGQMTRGEGRRPKPKAAEKPAPQPAPTP